ncbi:kinesin-domain-containing protein [Fomitiporia mediterranea MF3/22]|uniref:kinesin-domain-containing protein n=1 Tax=Fomitiporia mediterranea (strain MF3/22) TaxID=694068 RepID=UPI0004408052|nr:kinesin-domain-containing protein [Fomitiporia mediterranea MF3/22]EJD06038.1 kinesin-domain-containing protein [Fomitiporia mediterranea MF3/22]
MNPPPIPSSSSAGISRSRSVLAKARSELTTPVEDPNEGSDGFIGLSQSNGKKSQSQSSNDGSDSHIQVVIRCRRRSEREIQEGSPIIISTEGPRGQNVTIETAAITSVLGIVTLPPTRTYPFDVVFGPEADQSMVYQDVVHPMLDEVLKGYNCTLFAYGQTGTGKTYTMQGDVSLTPLGNPTAQAGMIPRALFKLFHQLESSGCDYSVKISYVELYNEELRDLLATDLSPPSGPVQPMSMGSQKDIQSGLKIFDDSSKRGVFIQGLEETPVKDFNDALALLAKGSQRRQIAATKFNDHSSRSHSVFSITVHSKETSTLGDDLLKVGKLNLVDLAGSENIGRSGAENKRAREAGMINQSLLTLGRVINALVDKSSHVPYRESKLTRLLQDSLGGRTKTCIIATVSPARSNMEETLSTLDYALRAKSIRNKPEVNQRMSRNALLKEYVGEIERLKSDLLAAREKNGIYFSEETWTQINNEHELRQTEVEECKKQVEMIESQMRSVREEFEQSIALLMKTDGELKTTKERLRKREGELVEKEGELSNVKVAFEEEVVVRMAHVATEDILDDVADGLKKVVEQSTTDVSGLFGKIDRKIQEFNANSKAMKGQSTLLDQELRSFLSTVETFVKSADQAVTKTKTLAEAFRKREISALSSHSQTLEEQIGRVTSALKTIQSKEDASEQNLTNIWTIVKEVQDRLANELSIWSGTTQDDIQAMCTDIEQAAATNFASTQQAIQSLWSVMERLVRDTRSAIESERKAAERQNELVAHAARAEIARLREQNARLSELLDSEKRSALKARDALVKSISSLLVDFTEERDRGLREAVSGIQESNVQGTENMETFAKKHDVLMSESSARSRAWSASLDKVAIDGAQAKLSATESAQSGSTSVQNGLSELRGSTSAAISSHSEGIIHVSKALNSCSKVFEREHKIKRVRIDTSTHLAEDAQATFQSTRDLVDSTSKEFDTFRKDVTAETERLQNELRSHSSSASSHVSSVQQYNKRMLEQGTRQNPPTGTTPQKRKWSYVDKWERTKNRTDLLREYYRQRGPISAESAHDTLQNEDSILDVQEAENLEEHTEGDNPGQEVGGDGADAAEHNNATSEEPQAAASPPAKVEEESGPLPLSESSSLTTLPSEDLIETQPAPQPVAPASRSNRRESGIPMKVQPPRPTLQEKSTNILPEPRPRVIRTTRVRR